MAEVVAAGFGQIGKNPSSVPASEKPRPFGAVVRDLLIEKGLVTAIGNPNWMEFSHQLKNVSYESLRKAVVGERPPAPKIMEACAEALDVSPDTFWEFRLAQAQRDFDPAQVGEEAAYANLLKWLGDCSGD